MYWFVYAWFDEVDSLRRKPVKEESLIEYYGERTDLPIFARQKKHLSTTEIVEALLDPDLEQDQICKTQPVGIENNLAFIVDLKHLKHVLCDELRSQRLPPYMGGC